MKIRQTVWWGIPGVLLASLVATAQVPNAMYMQGAFLQADGVTPSPGTHPSTVAIYTNSPTAALSLSTNVVANEHGVGDFTITDSRLPSFFQTCTNVSYQLTGIPLQPFVTAPYTFQAANLPMASGNFTVQGHLNVASNSVVKALTADNGGTLAVPLNVAGWATFTNLSSVTFNGNLDVVGGLLLNGHAEANYQTRFTNTSATTAFYGDTNNVVLSNAVVKTPFTIITTNLQSTGTSQTAPVDGFLMVYMKVTSHDTAGLSIKIGNLTLLHRYKLDASFNKQDLGMYTGATFPVPKGTSWSVSLVDAGDSDDISFTCYWLPLKGDG
jgi:hypothetical protein